MSVLYTFWYIMMISWYWCVCMLWSSHKETNFLHNINLTYWLGNDKSQRGILPENNQITLNRLLNWWSLCNLICDWLSRDCGCHVKSNQSQLSMAHRLVINCVRDCMYFHMTACVPSHDCMCAFTCLCTAFPVRWPTESPAYIDVIIMIQVMATIPPNTGPHLVIESNHRQLWWHFALQELAGCQKSSYHFIIYQSV